MLYLSGLPVNANDLRPWKDIEKGQNKKMLVFGNRHMEAIINGKKAIEKPSRRIRKLKKKVMSITRVF